MAIPAIIIGIFVSVGIGMLVWGVYSIFRGGGYFAGTDTRLIHYFKGNIKIYNWERFSGDIELNSKKGDISLQLRTGKTIRQDNSPSTFIPDIIYISGGQNVLEIESICRKRIIKNDPTSTNN